MFAHIVRNRSLVILGFAESVSALGSWITGLAVFSLIIFRGDGNVVQSSGILLASLLPMLLFSPVAGSLIDRFDRRRLMIASELLAGITVAGLIFVQDLFLIYLLLALQSIFNTIMMPARQAVVPDLVAREDLTSANAFLQQLAGLIKVGAPILAGALLALVNPHTAIIFDVISYALSAIILTRLPALPPHPKTETTEKEATASRTSGSDFWGLLRTAPQLRLIYISAFLTTAAIIGFDVLSAIFTRDILQGSEATFGLLIGLIGLGTVAGAAGLMLSKRQRNLWADVAAGLLLLTVLAAAVAIGAWVGDPALATVVLAAGCLLAGLGMGIMHVQIATLIQMLTPAALLGRAGGMFQSVAVAGQIAGILLTPLLVPGLLSVAQFFGLATLALLALVVYIVATARRSAPASQPQADAAQEPATDGALSAL
ncbi:MAG: MFS transporter [Caldilineales bacterium]